MPADLTTAIAATHPNPSPAQREAGNYRKGKVRLHGLLISIENPKGTRRRPEWKPLAAHYGYINRTEGRDGDHVDVYIGPNPSSELAFVVDQVTESGKRFDEHKAILGCVSKAQAKRLYLANYQPGWKCGPITAMTIEQFKTWLAKGDTTKRVAQQVSRYDKSAGYPGAAAPAPAPAAPPTQNINIESASHQVGETKSMNGKTYRLNERHRWERTDDDAEGTPTPGGPGEAAAPEQPPAPPSPANDHAQRHAFVASKIRDVHPEVGGLIQAIHQSPNYKASGEYSSFDVHTKVAAALHSTLQKHSGKKIAGGNVVDLGQGRVGFASEAGSLVVWPADETGRHQVSYTNKTGIVGRAMTGQQPGKTGESPDGNAKPAQPLGTAESPFEAEAVDGASEQEPEAPPLPSEVAARQQPGAGQRQQFPGGGESPFRQPGQQQQPTGGQSLASGKLPDEQAYDDAVGAPKERPAHVLLRRRANSSKEKFRAAFDNYEQAVHDRERPDRIRNLKRQAVSLREIYNEHHRQATRAEGEHRGRLKESGKQTKERMKVVLGIGPYKPKEKPVKPGKEPKQAPDANLPKGTMPDSKAKLSRSFSAGSNRGSIEFENDQHRDLYDLGAKHSYVGRGGRNKTSDRHVGDIKALTAKLAESTGMSESELKGHAAEVFKHTKSQMKGLKDGEHRAAKMPTAADTAPLVDQAEKNTGKGDVPTASPEAMAAAKEMGKLPKQAQLAGSAAQTYLKHSGLSVTPENHKVLQHAIRQGWVKDKKELRTLLKRAKLIHGKLSAASEAKGTGATNDHDALREAIRRKGNRERRESWAKIVKEQASAWDMTPQEYHETASGVYREFAAPMQEREKVKEGIRKGLFKDGGKTATRRIRQLQKSGGKDGRGADYSHIKGLDQHAEHLAANYPHLVEEDNPSQTVWNMLLEGKKPVPGKTSQEFTDHMGEFLQKGMKFGEDGEAEGMSPEELAELERQNAETSFGDEEEPAPRGGRSMVPFAKLRAGAVVRYRKWRRSLLN